MKVLEVLFERFHLNEHIRRWSHHILTLNWLWINLTGQGQANSVISHQLRLCWVKFYFPLFWGKVMYDNEFQTKGNKIETKDKIEPQHINTIRRQPKGRGYGCFGLCKNFFPYIQQCKVFFSPLYAMREILSVQEFFPQIFPCKIIFPLKSTIPHHPPSNKRFAP